MLSLGVEGGDGVTVFLCFLCGFASVATSDGALSEALKVVAGTPLQLWRTATGAMALPADWTGGTGIGESCSLCSVDLANCADCLVVDMLYGVMQVSRYHA
jgi:hypothetical protein